VVDVPKMPTPAPPANLTPEQLSRRKRINAVLLSGIALMLCCCGGVLLLGDSDEAEQPPPQQQPAGGVSASPSADPSPSLEPTPTARLGEVSSSPRPTAGSRPSPTRSPRPTVPRTSTPPRPEPTRADPPSVYYANCDAVRAAGAAPLYAGEPGYSLKLDRDKDGVACET
jgi:Excalibur calcium-binding domain